MHTGVACGAECDEALVGEGEILDRRQRAILDLSLSHTSGSTMCYNNTNIVLHQNGGAVRLREVSGEA